MLVRRRVTLQQYVAVTYYLLAFAACLIPEIMWTLKIKINIEFRWSKNLRSRRFVTGFWVFLFRNTTNGIHPYLAIASFTRPPSSEFLTTLSSLFVYFTWFAKKESETRDTKISCSKRWSRPHYELYKRRCRWVTLPYVLHPLKFNVSEIFLYWTDYLISSIAVE